MKRLGLALLLAIAGCGSPAPEQAGNQPNSAAAEAEAPAKEPVPPLAGQWTVTEIQGVAPSQVWPMTVDVTDGRFTLASECRRFVWDVRQDGNLVQFTRSGGRDCPRVRSPSEEMVEQPIDKANIAMFSEEGREVLLTGQGGSLALRRR